MDPKQETLADWDDKRIHQLKLAIERRAPLDAADLLLRAPTEVIPALLQQLEVQHAGRVFACLPENLQITLTETMSGKLGSHLAENLTHPDGTVGRVMEPVPTSFSPTDRVKDVIEILRPLANQQLVYAYVTDKEERLLGVVAMRELLFADQDDTISNILISEPFSFNVSTGLEQAMRDVLARHYPMYPVCSADGKLVGAVRGYALFEQQTYELTAQAGRMVGVQKEEHLNTSINDSLKLRHPWLQLNLMTAFIAGAVVGIFEDTIAQVVILAAFLPVLAGQSGNTGCQALAVTLRSMTLNELKPGMEGQLVLKEAILGVSNGLLVGITAALAMFGYAIVNGSSNPVMLAAVVLIAMLGSCAAAGISGALVPLMLRRFGADPVTASTIFLTTATDIASMGALLGLATLVLL